MAFPTPGTHRLLRHHDMQRLRQLTFASLEQDGKKRREIFSGADGRPDPLGAPGGPHCAGVSEGRRQGATAASAAGDAVPALQPFCNPAIWRYTGRGRGTGGISG